MDTNETQLKCSGSYGEIAFKIYKDSKGTYSLFLLDGDDIKLESHNLEYKIAYKVGVMWTDFED